MADMDGASIIVKFVLKNNALLSAWQTQNTCLKQNAKFITFEN